MRRSSAGKVAYERCGDTRDAVIGGRFTMATFEAKREPEAAAGVVAWIARPSGALVLAKQADQGTTTGCGKTHLLLAAREELRASGRWVEYADHTDMNKVVTGRASFDPSKAQETMQRWRDCDVLIIDHLGNETGYGQPVASVLCDVLRDGRPHALGTDMSREEVERRYGAHTASRLWAGAVAPRLFGKDYREKKT